MTGLETLAFALKEFANLSADDFDMSTSFWHEKSLKKGELFNNYKNVCKELGFILEGTFRSYIIDPNSGDEKNIFFYSKNGFVSAYKSFVNQIPCEYYTEALSDAKIVCIHHSNLQNLYKESHEWECFGRRVAELAASVVIQRMEDFLLKSSEQRYLELVEKHPELIEAIPLYHISSYLGIQGPSLSRIRKRISDE